jgi:hypothetical protein
MAGNLVDRLLTGPAFDPATGYSLRSAWDQLEKNGYLTPAQQQQINARLSQGTSSGAGDVFTNTQSSAQIVAKQLNGKVTEIKNGYKIEIPNPTGGNKPVVVRIMNEGSGGRGQPYFRVSIDGKGSYTIDGGISSDRALTHIDMSDFYLDQIKSIINSIGR